MTTVAMVIVPITLRDACAFVAKHHRHSVPPRGWKFGVGLKIGDTLVGVATAGRPIARMLDDGLTLEVNRTCTDGTRNANSMLYGAVWRAARAMGYLKCVTYTQVDETGASLRAAGFVQAKALPAAPGWDRPGRYRADIGSGDCARIRWEISAGKKTGSAQ